MCQQFLINCLLAFDLFSLLDSFVAAVDIQKCLLLLLWISEGVFVAVVDIQRCLLLLLWISEGVCCYCCGYPKVSVATAVDIRRCLYCCCGYPKVSVTVDIVDKILNICGYRCRCGLECRKVEGLIETHRRWMSQR